MWHLFVSRRELDVMGHCSWKCNHIKHAAVVLLNTDRTDLLYPGIRTVVVIPTVEPLDDTEDLVRESTNVHFSNFDFPP